MSLLDWFGAGLLVTAWSTSETVVYPTLVLINRLSFQKPLVLFIHLIVYNHIYQGKWYYLIRSVNQMEIEGENHEYSRGTKHCSKLRTS